MILLHLGVHGAGVGCAGGGHWLRCGLSGVKISLRIGIKFCFAGFGAEVVGLALVVAVTGSGRGVDVHCTYGVFGCDDRQGHGSPGILVKQVHQFVVHCFGIGAAGTDGAGGAVLKVIADQLAADGSQGFVDGQ
jgi:hypothetical protein